MKKSIFYIILASAMLAGCAEKQAVPTINASIQIDESGLNADVIRPESYNVTITNSISGLAETVQSVNGVASFSGLVPGVYSINANAQTEGDGFEYKLTGSSRATTLIDDGVAVTIPAQSAKISALMFKEAYINGSPGYYFRDQFYEIYNNGNETVYLDSLCFAEIVYANYDYSVIYQWDIPDPDKYVYAQTIWQIQGSGTDYPLEPGESAAIAQWATNHTAETLGGSASINNSGCEFEAIEGEQILWNGIVITDGPSINMKKVINANGYSVPQWLISVFNGSIVMFKPSKPLVNTNFVASINSSTVAREIALDDIYDALQWKQTAADADKLNLPAVLDAGFAIGAESYTNLSFCRKVTGTREDGTPILQDTNNSTNDFDVMNRPEHLRYNSKKPSWNTWYK